MTFARQLQKSATVATPPPNGGSITHGEQLVIADTTFTALGASSGQLTTPSIPGRGYFRGDTPLEFVPNQTYVYNDTPSNKGGIVPGGGMVIDGYTVPAGTYVAQFQEFTTDFYVSGSNNLFFRGCKIRGSNRAPGYWNTAAGWSGKLFIGYCDLGGTGASDAEYNEVPIKISSGSGGAVYRNHISYTTTGIQINTNGYDLTENYIEKLTYYYGPSPPPGESTDKHLNGITLNGGEACIRILRNYIVGQTPDDAGRTINQTDCISFFQDFGQFTGGGTNSDGSSGYQVKDNYVGGTGYCIYAGKNAGSASNSVQNMVMTGNKVTTQWYPNGGSFGYLSAAPTWGTLGNVWSGNTWADGPNAGQTL
jgi:hypothetical protein